MNTVRCFVSCVIASVCTFLFSSCTIYNSVAFQKELGVKLSDSVATKETVLLFHNLKTLAEKKIVVGHMNSTEYGVLWHNDTLRSDVHDVTGSFPGLYGWDFESIPKNDSDIIRHRVPKLVQQSYARGGINTFSWHARNPVTDGKYSDTSVLPIKQILPGGPYFRKYLRFLDSIADYTQRLKASDGTPIPIIFRPFHEFDGFWFWWGKKFCTRDEFIALWRITVEYLRTYRHIDNFLYAYSSDRYWSTEEDLMERYPGDNYVDVIGFDDYYDFNPHADSTRTVQKKLELLSSIAARRNKIAAFTETGTERIQDSTWFTKELYAALDDDSVKIAYVLLWRNSHKGHFYVPYRGHPAEEDFRAFRKKPRLLFEEDLPDMYHTVVMPDTIARGRKEP